MSYSTGLLNDKSVKLVSSSTLSVNEVQSPLFIAGMQPLDNELKSM